MEGLVGQGGDSQTEKDAAAEGGRRGVEHAGKKNSLDLCKALV